ncbi:MAG: hypothetical protein LLG45_08365 [Actinomycetia bacterium]|nr:hypothetical protein [Actinomycetes bacterium]
MKPVRSEPSPILNPDRTEVCLPLLEDCVYRIRRDGPGASGGCNTVCKVILVQDDAPPDVLFHEIVEAMNAEYALALSHWVISALQRAARECFAP